MEGRKWMEEGSSDGEKKVGDMEEGSSDVDA
jgi:hypothetical protein